MQVATSPRAGRPEVELSLTEDEVFALFGAPLKEPRRVKFSGNAVNGITLMPTSENHRKRTETREIKPLEPTARQKFAARLWLDPAPMGIRRESMGKLLIRPHIKPGVVTTPPIVDSWWAEGAASRFNPTPQNMPPSQVGQPIATIADIADVETIAPERERSIPLPVTEEDIMETVAARAGPGEKPKTAFGKLLDVMREVNRLMIVCDHMAHLAVENNRIIVTRVYKPGVAAPVTKKE